MQRLLPIGLMLLAGLVAGCSLVKVITVPVKATSTVVGGAADIID